MTFRFSKYIGLTALFLSFLLAVSGCSEDGGNSKPVSDADVTFDSDAGGDTDDVDETDEDETEVDTTDIDDEETQEPDAEETTEIEEDTTDTDEETDTGPTCNPELDCDSDGLDNCEEQELGTEKCDDDTDNDGLLDLEEIERGTDPLDSDTDNDGAEDGIEVERGLDPQDPSTYSDGVQDGERWRLTACNDPEAEPVNYYENSIGNWLLALPPAYDNYQMVDISGAGQQNMHAIAVYDDPASEVAGTLISDKSEETSSEFGPEAVVESHRQALAGISSIPQDFNSGGFETHDAREAAIGQYLVEISEAKSVRAFRNQLSKELSTISSDDISGMPSTEGAKYKRFRTYISVIVRDYGGTVGTQTLTSISVAPAQKFENRDQIKFRMDDLTNTTNIAEEPDQHALRCRLFEPEQEPKTDFYWVLDQSGSMSVYYDQVRDVANQFYTQLNQSALDYRLGVTSMYKADEGHIRPNNGWGTSINGFLDDISWVESRCSDTGFGSGCSSEEFGLYSAEEGIKYMNSAAADQRDVGFREDANVITIFMADEEAQTIQNNSLNSGHLSDFKTFFKQHTTAFAMVGDGEECGASDGEAYRQVALETGGSHASLCAENINETIEDIIIAAVGYAANYELPGTPISSTLRVYINGNWVPRSRTNGFDYFAQTNSISFFGDVLPKPPTESGEAGDFISITYESMLDVTKNCPNGRNEQGGCIRQTDAERSE